MDKTQIYQQKEYAEGYDDDRYGGEFGQYLHDLELNTFLSLIDLSYKNVIDVGAGTGKISIPLAIQSRHVVAVDSSEEMIKILSMKAKKRDVQLETIICDAHRLCFNDKAFDCAVSSRLLMHLDDWREAISELCRISAVATIIDFPPCLSFAGLGAVLRNIKCFFNPTIQTYKTFFLKDVVDEFHKHDFEIDFIQRQFLLPHAFHRRLNLPWLSGKIERFFTGFGLAKIIGAPVIVKAIRKNEPKISDEGIKYDTDTRLEMEESGNAKATR
jgi:2-polyprenyl-3-methyl-5-hydroxy-6-metoxy-1,4-benzoquinol methylase